MNVYAVYKNDNVLGVGTIHELAKILKTSEATVRTYGTPSKQKNNRGNGRILIKIEEEQENEL